MRFVSTLLFPIFLSSLLSAQDEAPGCKWGEGNFEREIGGYKVNITHVTKQSDSDNANGDCVVSVRNSAGKMIFKRVNATIVFSRQGELEGEEGPYVIFEAFEGGAHCCWIYWFVSLGRSPGRFTQLYNERPATFELAHSGRTLIRTLDGAFDYFDGVCHACTVFPAVTLQLSGRRLIDVSAHFRPEYDKEIVQAKDVFEREDGEDFVALKAYDSKSMANYDEARAAALTVVLAYLYSGREGKAWQMLSEMWPASDRPRIKKLILKTRAQGILSQVGSVQVN